MKFIIHTSIVLMLWNCNPKQDTLPEEKYHQYKFGEITILDQDFPANAFAPLEGQLRYCHNEYRWCPRISPYDIGYYPVLAISQNKKAEPKEDSAFTLFKNQNVIA